MASVSTFRQRPLSSFRPVRGTDVPRPAKEDLPDLMRENLAVARDMYDRCQDRFQRARDAGYIVENADSGERWRILDEEGAVAMSDFRRAKSELDHWAEYQRWALQMNGQEMEPGSLDVEVVMPDPVPDPRLPPEKELPF